MISLNAFDEYKLGQVIKVYEKSGGPDSDRFYLETHKVEYKIGDRPTLLEGKPLKISTIRSMVDALSKNKKVQRKTYHLGSVPSGLIYFDTDSGIICWHLPAMKRQLFFHNDLKIPSGPAYCPALLFLAHGSTKLSVFALKSNNRPKFKSKLFVAPFFNIDCHGEVCTGNVKLSKNVRSAKSLVAFWEKAFFGSEFSHLADEANVLKSENISVFWRKMIKTGMRFPKDQLVPHPETKTLADLFENNGMEAS